jgi:hypothetical protein
MINYSVDIQGHPTTIQLDPRKSGKSQITNISPILKSFEMVPTDN